MFLKQIPKPRRMPSSDERYFPCPLLPIATVTTLEHDPRINGVAPNFDVREVECELISAAAGTTILRTIAALPLATANALFEWRQGRYWRYQGAAVSDTSPTVRRSSRKSRM